MITKCTLYMFSVFFLFVLLIFTLKWSGVGDRMELRLWIDGNWSNLLLLIIMVIRVSQKKSKPLFLRHCHFTPATAIIYYESKTPIARLQTLNLSNRTISKTDNLGNFGCEKWDFGRPKTTKETTFSRQQSPIRHLFHLNITSGEFLAKFKNCLYSTLMMMMVILLCIDGNWGLI